MSDTVNRFSTRVENYAKYRPGYPREIVRLLESECGLARSSIIADIGSGTGILSEVFLKNGNRVVGVEPNGAMRAAAERLLKGYRHFVSIDGTAESTTLEPKSINFVTAAQAFHWFDRNSARREFSRVLAPGGYVVLIWNERRLDSTPFLRACEALLLKYGTDYRQVRHENVTETITEFFAPGTFKLKSYENIQELDFESLKGRVLSASYTPERGARNFDLMLSHLRDIFQGNAKNGIVTFEYDTRVFYGRLTPEG
jgi:ubiquinone/menaquinone biosynthesis C-methylase UbiE